MSAAIDGIKVAEEVARSYEEAPAAVRGASTVAQAVSPASLPVSTAEAVAALRAGKPVIFPTDTVFGLGVAVNHASSPAELYQLKQRTDDKPIAWLVGGIDDLARYGKNVSAQALELACAHWPGALTLIVEASDEVPPAYRSAAGTIALRVPNDPTARALIEQVGRLLPHRRISRGSLHPRAPKSFHLRSPHVWLRLRGRPWVVMPLQWWIARKRPRASFAKERSPSIWRLTIYPLTIQKPLRENDRFCVRGHYYERTSLSLLEAAIGGRQESYDFRSANRTYRAFHRLK